ncbi:MAG: acyltransferase [Gammaproteobacteria bacterium]|jgi:peptidoglycan/LPS O-acetylase OafA/YrhL|nr:acyltransferase [Gammaproteobacteria bacterium]
MSILAYRGEIDGLRAVSVLLIILFHLDILAFSGGYIGVDVFFVISGFLMTSIIVGDLDGGSFSFRQFYARRIARIVPALLVTVIFSLLAAMLLLSPAALVHTSQESLSAIFSVSNIFFWMESNYWAPKSQGFLLLHTWSLGVEEQFYLVYPLLLFAFHRLVERKGALLLLSLMFAGGLAANSFVLRTDAASAFYVSPLRFYEFAIGGFASLVSSTSFRNKIPGPLLSLASLAGLALVLYSALTFHYLTPFPGTYVLLPTFGAALVILAGGSVTARFILANPIMGWLGKTSYSLYLVHWPVIVLYRYCFGSTLSVVDQVILLATTLVLATALNRGIEQRFRFASQDRETRTGIPGNRALRLTGVTTALVSVAAALAIVGQGWSWRFPDSVQDFVLQDMQVSARERRSYMEAHCVPLGKVFCGERRAQGDNIMLLADSRGLDIYIALQAAYPGANIYASYAMGCAPVYEPRIGRSTHFGGCPGLNNQRLAAAEAAPAGDIVFLAMDFNSWRGKFVVDTARRLVQSGKRVYVLGQSRFLEGKTPQEIAIDQIRFSLDPGYVERFLVSAPFSLDEVYGDQINATGATYISTRDFFYHDAYRLFTRTGDDLLSYDGIHLSEAGAREFGQYLAAHYPLGDQ